MAVHDRMRKDLSDDSLYQVALERGLDFYQTVHDRHVFPTQEALEGLKKLEEEMPKEGAAAAEVMNELQKNGAPATLAGLGGRYFGFVHGSSVPAGIAAKMLATYWDQSSTLHVLSPVSAKLESIVEGWLKSIFNLPDSSVAGFVSGSSAANICGIAAARYRLLKNQSWDVNDRGLNGAPVIRIVTSKHAHSTIFKSISLLGLGKDNIEYVDVDDQGRIRVDLIPELDSRTMILLQAGNVNSGAFDDFETICLKAQKAGAWVHIDGAFGLWAAATSKLNYLTKGIELADSWATDGHKTLNTPYDAGVIMSSDGEALAKALDMQGDYIVLSDQYRDGMRFTPEMSKRARVIEFWATLKYLGLSGVDEMVTEMHLRADQFASEASQIKGIKVLNKVVFNQVILQCESDELTDALISEVQHQRVCWVGGSSWFGKRIVRVSVCSWMTTEEDITMSVASFEAAMKNIVD